MRRWPRASAIIANGAARAGSPSKRRWTFLARCKRAAGEGRAILVDCLTLWVSNLMAAGRDVTAETERLIAALPQITAPIVFVANEVGLGIVPDNALARAFRDEAGRCNQAVAAAATRVYFIAAGLPLVMKDESAVASVHRIERKNART